MFGCLWERYERARVFLRAGPPAGGFADLPGVTTAVGCSRVPGSDDDKQELSPSSDSVGSGWGTLLGWNRWTEGLRVKGGFPSREVVMREWMQPDGFALSGGLSVS